MGEQLISTFVKFKEVIFEQLQKFAGFFIDINSVKIIAIVFATLPLIVWGYLFFKKSGQSKKAAAIVFGIGTLTAPILLGLQGVWAGFPRFDLAAFVERTFTGEITGFMVMFILFAGLEEIIKMYVVAKVDKKTVFIKTISDTLRFGILSALGFAFSENIYYITNFWPMLDAKGFAGMYMFRAGITTVAHMIFSSVFAYYYAVGKFSIDVNAQQRIVGKQSFYVSAVSKIFQLPEGHAFQQAMIVKGLVIATLMHAVFNFVLQYNYKAPVMIAVALGYFFLQYLLKRKSGNLILLTDVSTKKKSTFAKKDEEVVIELMGLWFEDKRYVDVIHICERLLERDPDNHVVQLFKAKAMDKLTDKDTYKSILGTVVKTKNDLSENDKNILSKYTEEKEMFAKVKQMIREQMKKEGKKYIDPEEKKEEEKKENQTGDIVSKPKENILEDIIEGSNFDIKL